jgi:hypothetical protein
MDIQNSSKNAGENADKKYSKNAVKMTIKMLKMTQNTFKNAEKCLKCK